MKSITEAYFELEKFKKLMGINLTEERIKYIWGKSFEKGLENSFQKSNSSVVDEKVQIGKRNIKYLKVFNWVRFVGISGSVSAGFARKDDDIDIFIVVRDGCAWLYRGIVLFRNIFHRKIRNKGHKMDVKDKLCINLIREERDLVFDNDMFNFHELMSLIPLFNDEYLKYIYTQNIWLRDEYFVKRELFLTRETRKKGIGFILKVLNFFAFISQFLFMIVSGHNPENKRIWKNFQKGRIEFFDLDFKERKMKRYLKGI